METLKSNNLVWYAAYGSNILQERFLCYIRGGQPAGSKKKYSGCDDKTLPRTTTNIQLNRELYFAKSSASWQNGGVAFVHANTDNRQKTLARMYLITSPQFIDVVKQETDHDGILNIDFVNAGAQGSLVFKERSWYGNLIWLGWQDGHQIFTFTNETNIIPTTKPGANYLKTIISGLQEAYADLTDEEIVDYFISKAGVAGNYTREELFEIIP